MNATKLIATAAALAFVITSLTSNASAQVNGRNVQMVTSSDNYGNRLGTLRNMGDGTWMEDGLNGRQGTHRFREVMRDEWSVYLNDASRGMDLQIDLYQKKIKYKMQGQSSYTDLYKVLDPKAGPTGRTVRHLDYYSSTRGVRGTLTQYGNAWQERNSDGVFNFNEVTRDDWSVSLIDHQRKIQLLVNLHTKEVLIGHGTRPNSKVYDITSAR